MDLVHLSHRPVLLNEVMELLQPLSGKVYLDCTLGEGGHTKELLMRSEPDGRVIGIDCDAEVLMVAKKVLDDYGGRIEIVHGNYADAEEILHEHGSSKVDGILLDLGFSSIQIETPARGFSFKLDGPLDMRMNRDISLTAEKIVNKWNRNELIKIFREYGEERYAGKIAERIIRERQKKRITKTLELAKLIMEAVPWKRNTRIHPATRVFQALRITVNRELDNLSRFLKSALSLLKIGGRIAIISFHSLEDRIVKRTFIEWEKGGVFELLTVKVIVPSAEEVLINPRSRSAKLRAGMRIA